MGNTDKLFEDRLRYVQDIYGVMPLIVEGECEKEYKYLEGLKEGVCIYYEVGCRVIVEVVLDDEEDGVEIKMRDVSEVLEGEIILNTEISNSEEGRGYTKQYLKGLVEDKYKGERFKVCCDNIGGFKCKRCGRIKEVEYKGNKVEEYYLISEEDLSCGDTGYDRESGISGVIKLLVEDK